MRTVVGVRVDYFRFDVDGEPARKLGQRDDALVSPKGSLVLGPWLDTELYLSGGLGLHSNDARGVTDPVDPADPLVQTQRRRGGRAHDASSRGSSRPWRSGGSTSTPSSLFVGDAGTHRGDAPEPAARHRARQLLRPDLDWLTFDADVSLSRARFRDSDPAGDHIPGSVETVVAAGVTRARPRRPVRRDPRCATSGRAR